jgi:hypothetical protein
VEFRMTVLYILGAVLVVAVAMEVLGRLGRVVYRDVPLTNLLAMFEWYVVPTLRRGGNGTRVVMYDRSSGIMVQVIKSLDRGRSWRDYRPDGKVNLRVLKTFPRGPRKEGRTLLRGPLSRRIMWRGDRVNPCVPYWRLPSPYAGEVLGEVDSGASFLRLRSALREAFSKDRVLSACAFVDLWFEKTTAGWRTQGSFEDEEIRDDGETGRGSSRAL